MIPLTSWQGLGSFCIQISIVFPILNSANFEIYFDKSIKFNFIWKYNFDLYSPDKFRDNPHLKIAGVFFFFYINRVIGVLIL